MKIIILIMCGLLVVGCSTSRPYTKTEKITAGIFIGGQLADTATTLYGLNNSDVYETNIILGEQPSPLGVVAFKVGVLGLGFLIGHFWPDTRTPLFSILGGSGIAISIYNVKIITEND